MPALISAHQLLYYVEAYCVGGSTAIMAGVFSASYGGAASMVVKLSSSGSGRSVSLASGMVQHQASFVCFGWCSRALFGRFCAATTTRVGMDKRFGLYGCIHCHHKAIRIKRQI